MKQRTEVLCEALAGGFESSQYWDVVRLAGRENSSITLH